MKKRISIRNNNINIMSKEIQMVRFTYMGSGLIGTGATGGG